MYEPMYVRINTKRYMDDGEIIVTSEPMDIDTIVGNTGKAPKGSFDILRKRLFCEMLNDSEVAYCKVLAYLIENRTLENCVEISTKELAERTMLSRNTVMKIIDKMERSSGVVQGFKKIMINPYMIHRGDSKRESYLNTKFLEMQKKFKKNETKEQNKSEPENSSSD